MIYYDQGMFEEVNYMTSSIPAEVLAGGVSIGFGIFSLCLPLTPPMKAGSEVRIAAQGPQGASVVGVTNQTDLFHTIARALGLE